MPAARARSISRRRDSEKGIGDAWMMVGGIRESLDAPSKRRRKSIFFRCGLLD